VHFVNIWPKFTPKMNHKLLPFAGLLLLGLTWLAGCEAARDQPSATGPRGEIIGLTSERAPTEAEILARAAARPPAPIGGEGWQPLFDGQTLTGWRVTPFAGAGQVECRQGLILLWRGSGCTGINWTNPLPGIDYEVALDALRVAGHDCFCSLTFPVRTAFCSLVIGGAGGEVVGLSSLDDLDATENETCQFISFETGRWYRLRLRVTEQKIEAWIEQKKVVDVMIAGRKLTLPSEELEAAKPLGVAACQTTTALRGITIRHVTGPADSVK
jgi:hypothetical protein